MFRMLCSAVLAGVSIGCLHQPFVCAETGTAPTKQSENSIVADMTSPRALYLLRCSGCHQANGAGAPSAGIPPLPGYLGPMASDPEGRTYIAHVPGITAARLNDAQLVDVLNYLIDEWGAQPNGKRPEYFTVDELRALKATHIPNVVEFRRSIVGRLEDEDLPIAAYPWP